MMLLTVLLPLLCLLLIAVIPALRENRLVLIAAPLPALLVGLFAPEQTLIIDWVFFGLHWQLDDISRPLLVMTSLLWMLGGLMTNSYLSGQPDQRRYIVFWLLTLSGNLALLVARDLASFYTGFAVMTFAGYGLVIHSGTKQALLAGKVYLVMAVLGELAILAGFILLLPDLIEPLIHFVPLAITENSQPFVVSLLLLTGFGVKAGLAGLHLWLPLAHPVAPTPASAVLSGAMIKAGLLAWIQVLPGTPEMAALLDIRALGILMVTLGFCSAFGAAVIGVMQQQSKAVLAYSSISQMGLITVLLGAAILHSALWPLMVSIAVMYAVHHGLAKGALFFSVGLAHQPGRFTRSTVLVLAALPALALAGVPLTSGAAAKYLMKAPLYEAGLSSLVWWLTLTAAATTLLMLRFLVLLAREYKGDSSKPEGSIGWTCLTATFSSMVIIWWLPGGLNWQSSTASLFDSLWPVLIAGVTALVVATLFIRTRARDWQLPAIPAGDIVWPLQYVFSTVARLYAPINTMGIKSYSYWQKGRTGLLRQLSRQLQRIDRYTAERAMQRYIALTGAIIILLILIMNLFAV